MFLYQKSIFVDIFFSFNPNRVMGINDGYFPVFCRVCFKWQRSDIIGLLLVFLQFKEFEFYWAAVLIKDLFTHFRDFRSQTGVVIMVTPKHKEEKSEWFCSEKLFNSSFKEKRVFEQKFAFSRVVFCSHAAISLWFYFFFDCLDRTFS